MTYQSEHYQEDNIHTEASFDYDLHAGATVNYNGRVYRVQEEIKAGEEMVFDDQNWVVRKPLDSDEDREDIPVDEPS